MSLGVISTKHYVRDRKVCKEKNDQNFKRIHSVESKKEMNNYGIRKYVGVKTEGRKVSCLLDTGSDL